VGRVTPTGVLEPFKLALIAGHDELMTAEIARRPLA
jgi:hypothetical protein